MVRDMRVQGAGLNGDYESESYRSMLAITHFYDAYYIIRLDMFLLLPSREP